MPFSSPATAPRDGTGSSTTATYHPGERHRHLRGQTGVVIADIVNEALNAVYDDTNQVRLADTLCLPVEQMNLIATKPIGDNANRSVLAYIRENNIYTQMTGNPLMIRTLRQLETAGAGSTDRMIAYAEGHGRAALPRTAGASVPGAAAPVHDTYVYYGHGVLAGLEVHGADGHALPRQHLGQTGGAGLTTKSKERLAADALIDEAQGFVEEVLAATNHTVPALLPLVGGWVRYQVRRGHSIPMLVTAVYSPSVIDGVAFSARPSDVGNSYGSRGHQRVKRGEGDGEWD